MRRSFCFFVFLGDKENKTTKNKEKNMEKNVTSKVSNGIPGLFCCFQWLSSHCSRCFQLVSNGFLGDFPLE